MKVAAADVVATSTCSLCGEGNAVLNPNATAAAAAGSGSVLVPVPVLVLLPITWCSQHLETEQQRDGTCRNSERPRTPYSLHVGLPSDILPPVVATTTTDFSNVDGDAAYTAPATESD